MNQLNGKQNFNGRNIFVEEAIEKNYSSLGNFKRSLTTMKAFKQLMKLRNKLSVNEDRLKMKEDQ